MTDAVIAFCDGACSGNPGPGGYGTILVLPGGQIQEFGGAKNPTTNNEMEMRAILEALLHFPKDLKKAVIYSDSSYALNGITQWVWGWLKRGWKTAEGNPVANIELWQKLLDASQPFKGKITWSYVPGHAGIAGNERVDVIARTFSEGDTPSLYRGSATNYSVTLEPYPPIQDAPQFSKSSSKPQKPLAYLSYVHGKLERHETWAECEKRVKGQTGAKFKKVFSEAEEKECLKKWGLSA